MQHPPSPAVPSRPMFLAFLWLSWRAKQIVNINVCGQLFVAHTQLVQNLHTRARAHWPSCCMTVCHAVKAAQPTDMCPVPPPVLTLVFTQSHSLSGSQPTSHTAAHKLQPLSHVTGLLPSESNCQSRVSQTQCHSSSAPRPKDNQHASQVRPCTIHLGMLSRRQS